MNDPLPIDAHPARGQGPTPKGQGPTGPKTPEGKRISSLNAYRHGLTGQVLILTPDEQQAYDNHTGIVLEALAPATDFERLLAQSISDNHWRLNRARAIESSIFAMGMQSGVDDTGHPQVDDAFAQARTWLQDARNLNLLTIYQQRIQRSVDKDTARLETLQAKRKQEAAEAIEQAKLLYRFAQAQGKPYQPEAFFTTAPQTGESVFSAAEVARDLDRAKLLADAKTYRATGKLPQKDEPGRLLEALAS